MFRKFTSLFIAVIALQGIFTSCAYSQEHNDAYRIEKRLWVNKNDPYNFLLIPPSDLQKKLQNPADRQKIVTLLFADPCQDIIDRDIDIYFRENAPADTQKLEITFPDGDQSITREHFLANRKLLFSNPIIIKALLDYAIETSANQHYFFWSCDFLITEPEFRLQMTDHFLTDLANYLSEDNDKEIYYFNQRYGTYDSFIEFIGELKKQDDTHCLNKIANFVEQHIKSIHYNVFKATVKSNPLSTARLLAACSQLLDQQITHKEQGAIHSFSEALIDRIPEDFKVYWAKKRLARQGLIKFAQNLTQTEAHFWMNSPYMFHCQEFFKDKPDMVQLLDRVLDHERTLSSQGKYVFYHGQRWHLYFLEDLYTKLWELKYKKSAKNYLFIRFMPHIANTGELQKQMTQESETRMQLLSQGRDEEHRLQLLFLNYSLFANSTNPGSFSLGYFTTDSNIRSTDDLDTQTIFHALDLDGIYTRYATQLKELETSFAKLSKQMNIFCRCGNLLQIAITPETLKKCLYLAAPGGHKRTVRIEGIGETDDVALIIDTLKTAPHKIKKSDVIEFCLILTRDLALQPDNGIEVYSFNPVEPDAWKAYEAQRDALLAQMAPQIA